MAEVMEKVAPPEHRSRAAYIAEEFGKGVNMIKTMGRTANDAAEEWMEDNTARIKRHPIETVVGSFAAGAILGSLLTCMFRRK